MLWQEKLPLRRSSLPNQPEEFLQKEMKRHEKTEKHWEAPEHPALSYDGAGNVSHRRAGGGGWRVGRRLWHNHGEEAPAGDFGRETCPANRHGTPSAETFEFEVEDTVRDEKHPLSYTVLVWRN